MTHYINFNGNITRSGEPIVTADNRSFRYGDGIFETIRYYRDSILLADYHFERLFAALKLLEFERPDFFSRSELTQQIKDLCKKNNHQEAARVRLVVFRGNGGLYDPQNHFPNYVIQSWPFSGGDPKLENQGLKIDVFTKGKKAIDDFSNLKSNNYLLYAMGALHAKKNQLNDCLILNSHNRICDTTKANIFWVKNRIIFTPPLSEGCVAGVMRRHLLSTLPKKGFTIFEKEIDVASLQTADEIFLTNALSSIQWVEIFNERSYRNAMASSIFHTTIKDNYTI